MISGCHNFEFHTIILLRSFIFGLTVSMKSTSSYIGLVRGVNGGGGVIINHIHHFTMFFMDNVNKQYKQDIQIENIYSRHFFFIQFFVSWLGLGLLQFS